MTAGDWPVDEIKIGVVVVKLRWRGDGLAECLVLVHRDAAGGWGDGGVHACSSPPLAIFSMKAATLSQLNNFLPLSFPRSLNDTPIIFPSASSR